MSERCKSERKYGWRASSSCFDWNRLRTCRRRVSFLPALFSARPASELRHSSAASAPTAWALAFSLTFAAPAASGQSYLWLTEEDSELGLTGNSYTGVHNLSLSWRTTTGRRLPTGKPAQTERGHVHSGVVVLHLTFGRARWVTRNHLQPVYSPALVLPRMHSCTPERSTLNVPGQKRSGRPRKGRGVPRSALPLRLHHGIRDCCAITAQSSSKSPPPWA